MAEDSDLQRPAPMALPPLPPVPDTAGQETGAASVELSRFRSELSELRSRMSEHRTDLSEFRTSLSQHRTDLSQHRSDLSQHRTDLSGERTEMSMRRTGMSIQRTRMSADRTLMSVQRTSLSLIGFGFTLYQTFDKLHDMGTIRSSAAPRNFGAALIVLGILLLVGGISRHLQFAFQLRHVRAELKEAGLVHGEMDYPVSLTLITSILLLAIGVLAITGIVFHIEVFGA